ncbi:MAG: ribosomal protein S18-alanine N-acetyltransferase [Anaerolineales bacterium]|nr:ribosomal protein S18-alanine N-acetyltransferase [Anaerolineales bacterium]
MTVAIRIRPMNFADIEGVLEIDRISFPTPWPESSYRYELSSNPFSRLWVAEVVQEFGEPKLAGMIVLWLIEDEAHIATLAVHPDFRRERIGMRLLAYALHDSLGHGVREAMLEVRQSNLAAQSLYQKFGFEIVARRPRYYKDNNEDALLMNLMDLDQAALEVFLEGDPENARVGYGQA